MRIRGIIQSPKREMLTICILLIAGGIHYWQAIPVLFGFVIFVGALPTIIEGTYGAWKERQISLDTFNSLAVIAACFTEDFYASSFIVLMLQCASILDWHTQVRAHNAVAALLALRPETAWRERDDAHIEEIPADQVCVDDRIIVKDGGRVPVDGEVIYGDATIDEASLTGESVPVYKRVGDHVWSGTALTSGHIRIRATAVGKDATIARMAALVEHAAQNKGRLVSIADRFAGFFLPFVIILGVTTYVVTQDAMMTIALFLVACADDIAVSIPLAMTAAIGEAARRGVIIKGGAWLEVLSAVRHCVLDKTGTLTYGALTVQNATIMPPWRTQDFWHIVARIEKFSDHPVGRAIFAHAHTHGTHSALQDVADVRVVRGSGIIAHDAGKEIAIGDIRIIDALHGCSFAAQETMRAAMTAYMTQHVGVTTVVVVYDAMIAGYITVSDTVRHEASQALSALRAYGVDTIMFTGDHRGVAERIGAQLGVDAVHAEMTPERKMTELAQLTHTGVVMMVGDGVNDAPALARADVGVAMGARGSHAAIESADVVILSDRIDALPEMIALGQKTFSVIRLNVVIWIVTNLIGFALVLTGVFGPVFAAIYNFGTDFLPIINALRLFRTNKKIPMRDACK